VIGARYHLDVLVSNPRDFIRRAALFVRRRYYRLLRRRVRRDLNGIKFTFDFTLPGHVDLMYLGIYEPELIEVLRRHLVAGGVFIDVGANVGYVTAVAAGLVGTAGQVHAFEPVPRYFQNLVRVRNDNPTHTILANACALGDRPGVLDIHVTRLPNMGWNTMVPGFMDVAARREVHAVRVERLDEYLLSRNLHRVDLVKIDTEGFEYPVLRGFVEFVRRVAPRLPPIYLEIAPQAYPLLGITLDDLRALLAEYGYQASSVDGHRVVDVTTLTKTTNVLLRSRHSG